MASPPSQAEHLSSGLEKSRCWGLVFKLDSGSNFHAQFAWQQADICFRCQRRWPEDHNRTGMSSWPYPQSQNPTPCLIADLGWWYLTPAHNSTGDPWKAHGRPCGCSARTTCLSLFCFVNIITPKRIYIYIYSITIFLRWPYLGIFHALQAAAWGKEHAQHNPCLPPRCARGTDCTVYHCLCFQLVSACSTKAARQQPRSCGGFLQGAAASVMLWKDATLKLVQAVEIIIIAFIKAVYKSGT